MLKRSRNRKLHATNLAAASIADQTPQEEEIPHQVPTGKNPAAVELGRLGGRKGGKARAVRLTAAERSDIARRAALARWRNAS